MTNPSTQWKHLQLITTMNRDGVQRSLARRKSSGVYNKSENNCFTLQKSVKATEKLVIYQRQNSVALAKKVQQYIYGGKNHWITNPLVLSVSKAYYFKSMRKQEKYMLAGTFH